MRKLSFLFVFLILPTVIMAQNDDLDLENFAERLFQIQDENISYEDIYESLLLLYSNKLNLNKANPEDLAALYILSPIQISSFFHYRDELGFLLSINELQAIQGFDIQTIRSILPFVTVKESITDTRSFLQRVLKEENNYLLLRYTRRLEDQLGYMEALPLDSIFLRDQENVIMDTLTQTPQRYIGSADKIYGRYRTSHKDDFSIGLTFEKDAGEAFTFSNKQSGFDFYSYHLLLENKLGFEKIVIGDFQLQSGQGLLFGAGFSPGKGAETVNAVKKNSVGLKPYTSVLEAGFFRGIGLTKRIKNLSTTLFYSKLKQDGSIQQRTNLGLEEEFLNEEEFVNSIQQTGFHRTERELSAKDQLTEASVGFSTGYRPHRRLEIGLAGLNTSYSVPVIRRPNNYNQFEFNGSHNFLASAYFNYSWENFIFFGEGARSKSGGIGGVGGLMASLSAKIDMAIILRQYDRDFHSFYGNSFAENSRNINESGVYWGLQVRPQRMHKINLYFDKFTFPWLRYRTEAPSEGYEFLVRYTYQPKKNITVFGQLREQNKQVSVPEENLNRLQEQLKRNYLVNIDYEPKPGLHLKTRVQGSTLLQGQARTKGIAVVQDVNFSIWRLKLYTRMAIFDSDDFGNSQFVYENDVLYAFSIPAYIGTGIRKYLMIRHDPSRYISLWVRYAQTTFYQSVGITTLGSSLEQSIGDTASEIKAMLRIKF